MKKYAFKLEKVLKYRDSLVEQKKIEVTKANQVVKEKETLLQEAKEERKRVVEERNQLRHFKINDIKKYTEYFKIMDRRIKYYEYDLIKAQKFLEGKKQEYVESLREKKVLVKLKEKDQLKYDYEMRKEEEKLIDGLVSYQSGKDGGQNG